MPSRAEISSIGDGGSGPCCAKNPTQKNVPKTPPRKKTGKKPVLTGKPQQPPPENSQGQMGNHKKPVLIGKIGKMGNRKNGKV